MDGAGVIIILVVSIFLSGFMMGAFTAYTIFKILTDSMEMVQERLEENHD